MISLRLPRLPEIPSSSSSLCQDLGLAKVCGGFLVAAGASKHHNWFRLPVKELRPKDWLAEAHLCSKRPSCHSAEKNLQMRQASLTQSESPHAGRTTALASSGARPGLGSSCKNP